MRPPSSDYRRIESRRAQKSQTEPFHPLPGVRFQIGDSHFPAFFTGRPTVQVSGRDSVFVGGLILGGRSYFSSFFPWCTQLVVKLSRINPRELLSRSQSRHCACMPWKLDDRKYNTTGACTRALASGGRLRIHTPRSRGLSEARATAPTSKSTRGAPGAITCTRPQRAWRSSCA